MLEKRLWTANMKFLDSGIKQSSLIIVNQKKFQFFFRIFFCGGVNVIVFKSRFY